MAEVGNNDNEESSEPARKRRKISFSCGSHEASKKEGKQDIEGRQIDLGKEENMDNENENEKGKDKECEVDKWLKCHDLSEYSQLLKYEEYSSLDVIVRSDVDEFIKTLKDGVVHALNKGHNIGVDRIRGGDLVKFRIAHENLEAKNKPKKWTFDNIDKFVKELESTFGSFKAPSEIKKPSCAALINGEFLGRDTMKTDLSKLLIKRLARELECEKKNMQKSDRFMYPISGIVGCRGAGKTAMLRECWQIFTNNFDKTIESALADEGKYNSNYGDIEMNGLSKHDKEWIVKKFEKNVCISIEFDKMSQSDNQSEGNNKNKKKNNMNDNMNDNNGKFDTNVWFLWRIVFEIVNCRKASWLSFCERLKSFSNSSELACCTVGAILNKIYENHSIFLLIDKLDENGEKASDILLTSVKLMTERQFMHCVAACSVGTTFTEFHLKTSRPVQRLDCNLFDVKLLLDIFEKDIKYVKKYGAHNLKQFVLMILDTIGLPRMIECLLKAFKESGKTVGATGKLFKEKVYEKYGAIPKRNLKFIKTLLGQRSGFGGGCTDEKISTDYDDTWDDMQARGFIKIERDGVYMSPLIVDAMMDDDSKEIKFLVDACCAQVGINLFGLNEQLMGQVFKGYKMAYIRYFNLTSCWWKISRNLRDCVVCVEPLKLGDIFKEKNTIAYAKNENEKDKDAGIDAIINREDMHWMLSNTTIDMKKLDEMMAGFSKQVGKRKKESKLEYTFVIAGDCDTKNNDDTENLDCKYGFVLLTGKGMQLHLLPLLRRRVLPAAVLAQIIGD